jgi:ParB family chromosome partitioning protein
MPRMSALQPSRVIVSADPFRCRLWSLHDRFASELTEQSCQGEIESLAAHGQKVPALGRPLKGDPDYDIELIYGARRLFAVRHLKMPLLVELRELTDREGLIAMDIENRQRRDISPYERGLSYKRWLQSRHFQSQEDISRTLKISTSQVSRLLQLARLPAVVVDAFRDPAQIRENWGLDIIEALDDPRRRAATIRRARTLGRSSPRLQARDVVRKLLSFAAHGPRPKTEVHDKIVAGCDGSPLFRVRYLSNSISLIFSAKETSPRSRARIEARLTALLQGTREQTAPAPKRRINAARSSPRGTHEHGTGLVP